MQHALLFTDEEIEVLNAVMNADLADSRIELRHTRNPEFRARIRNRIEVEKQILDKAELIAEGFDPMFVPAADLGR